MGRIYMSGDTHGTIDFQKLVRLAAREKLTYDDYIIICGDCGIVWNRQTDAETIALYESLKTNVLFVDGNHENHVALAALPVEEWKGGRVHRVSEHVTHLMRGEIFTIEGNTFFCMGGADSSDKLWRTPGLSWWKEERISEEDVRNAEQNLAKVNYRVDYVVTHVPPYRYMDKMVEELTQCGEEISYHLQAKLVGTLSGERLQEIAPKIKYKKWFSGHLHTDMRIGKFYSLYEYTVRIV